jgi:polar amino acid transport system substrate-binding protein
MIEIKEIDWWLMMKQFILIMFLVCLNPMTLYSAELKIYTEDYPPLNYFDEQTKQAAGFTVELVTKLLARTGIKAAGNEIKVYPWARAYRIIQEKENVMLFSMTRSEAREHLFKWVGPVAPRTIRMWKLKERRDIVAKNLDDAKKYIIGGVLDFDSSKDLQKKGFRVEMVNNVEQNWQKLLAGRIDIYPSVDLDAAYYMKKLGKSFSVLEPLVDMETRYDFYLALSKNTPDDIVNKLQKALNSMKADGSYDALWRTYTR